MRRGDVKERADFYYHKPEFEIEAKRVAATPHKLVRLEDLCSQITDGTHYTPEYTESGVRFLSVKDVREFEIDFENSKFISDEEHETFKRRCNPESNDILLTKVGTIGLAAVIPENAPEFDLFVSVCLLKLHDATQSQFVCAVLNSPIARLQFARELKGIGVPDLHLENIRRILIPLPPRTTQKALVAKLETARNSRRSKFEKADALLSQLDAWLLDKLGLQAPIEDKRACFAVTMKDARSRFDPFYHSPEFHHVGHLMNSVDSVRLGEVVEFSDETWNPVLSKDKTFRYIEISGVNVQSGLVTAQETLVSEAPSRARMLVRDGDILVSTTRPHHGAIAQVDTELDSCVASTGFAVIRRTDARINRAYLWCILRSRFSLRQMLQRSSGGNYPAITPQELKQVRFPLPSLKIQQSIAAEIQSRRETARQLRGEAQAEWDAAKASFESALLGEGGAS